MIIWRDHFDLAKEMEDKRNKFGGKKLENSEALKIFDMKILGLKILKLKILGLKIFDLKNS